MADDKRRRSSRPAAATDDPAPVAPDAADLSEPPATEPAEAEAVTLAEPVRPGTLPDRDSTPDRPHQPPSPVPAPRRGALAPFLGGAAAAVLGFGLSHFDAFGLRPAAGPDLAQRLEAAEALARTAQGSVDEVKAAIAALPAGTDTGATDALAAELSALRADLDARLAAINAAPAADTGAMAAELERLKASVAALSQGGGAADPELAEKIAEAERIAEEAAARTEASDRRAALQMLATALDAGTPYAASLAALGDADVPAALADRATNGVPTLRALQTGFPDAARAALDAARRADPGDGWGDRLANFFGSQTGARSIAPRDGDDPDAVLSRAEAALADGRLAEALAELDALPETAALAMAAWRAEAEARQAALAALSALLPAPG